MIRLFSFILLLGLTIIASEDMDYSLAYIKECDLGTSIENNTCLNKVYEDMDKKLNTLYQTLKHKTTGNDTILLRSAQRSWLDFKKAECAFYNPKEFNSNSFYVSQQLVCEIHLTDKRIKDLERYLANSGCGSCRW